MGRAIIVPNVTFSSNLGKVTASGWPFKTIELSMQTGMKGGAQGSAVYGDYLFGGQKDNGQITIYNLSTSTLVQTVTVPDSAVSGRHMNSLCFGHLKYDESDEFPLLYGGGNLSSLINIVDVYRVTKTNDTFTITRVGSIDVSILGYVDVAYWGDKLILCKDKVYIVNPPSASETSHTLTQSDIVAQYDRGSGRAYTQQPCTYKNYVCLTFFNTNTSKGTYDFIMKVMDLNNGDIVMYSEFNYNNNYNIEFEAAVVWDGSMYMVNKDNGFLVKMLV